MPVITLTSDFGITDYRAAAMKGKILQLNETLQVADISHQIDAYDLQQTSYIIRNAYPYFPKGSVHIIAVDSFYSRHQKALICKANDQYFIAPDNGVLSLIFFDQKPQGIYEITFNHRFDDVVNFQAADIFVPAAVHLANGGLPEVIGRKYKNAKQAVFLKPVFNKAEKMIVGQVMYVDNFGSLVTNISRNFFEKSFAGFSSFKITVRNIGFTKIYNNYKDIVTDWENEASYYSSSVVIFNEAGLLELSIYKGSENNGAHTLFGVKVGENVFVEFE